MPDGSAAATRGLTRRQGLIAIAVVGPLGLLAACTGSDDAGPPSGSAAPSTAKDDVATNAAVEEQALIARYDSVLAGLPTIDATVVTLLTTIRDEHVQHRDALGGTAAPSASDAASTITVDSALRELAKAERQASRSRIRACVATQDAELARLLAFIGASEAAHAPALRKSRT